MTLRLWWAMPTVAAAATAVGMGIVIGPTLGEHVTVPRQLVLPVMSPSSPPVPKTTVSVKRHPRSPAVKAPAPVKVTVAPTPAWSPVQRTHVVAPRRPVVTASNDDGSEHDQTSLESESGDP